MIPHGALLAVFLATPSVPPPAATTSLDHTNEAAIETRIESAVTAPADSAATDSSGASIEAPDSVQVTIRARRHRHPPLVPLRDGAHAVRVFVSDAWYVVSSPGRMHARDALWMLSIGAVGGVLFAYDPEILDAFQRSKGDRVYELAVKPGRAIQPVGNMGNTLAYYFAGMGAGYVTHFDPLRELTSEFIESHWISGGARNIAEVTVGRRRPFEGYGPRRFEFMGGSSFPSGHASVVFELATILSYHVHSTPFRVLCYGAATSAVLERIDSKGHWPSDCFIGAATGTIIAHTVVRRHAERRAAREAEREQAGVPRRAQFGPALTWRPDGFRAAMTARF